MPDTVLYLGQNRRNRDAPSRAPIPGCVRACCVASACMQAMVPACTCMTTGTVQCRTWLVVVAAQVAQLHDARASLPLQQLPQLPPRRGEFVCAPPLQVQVAYDGECEVCGTRRAESWVQAA